MKHNKIKKTHFASLPLVVSVAVSFLHSLYGALKRNERISLPVSCTGDREPIRAAGESRTSQSDVARIWRLLIGWAKVGQANESPRGVPAATLNCCMKVRQGTERYAARPPQGAKLPRDGAARAHVPPLRRVRRVGLPPRPPSIFPEFQHPRTERLAALPVSRSEPASAGATAYAN